MQLETGIRPRRRAWATTVPAALALLAGCAHTAGRRAAVHPSADGTPAAHAESAGADGGDATPFVPPCADDDPVGCTNGCNDRRVEDCATLATMYLSGTVISRDVDRAVQLFEVACNEGSARGCLKLGDAYRDGVIKGDAQEVNYYQRACDAGANLGCVAAAKAYLTGQGVGQDPVFAASLLQRVCDRGNAVACFELARLYEAGHGVRTDRDRASELFAKACNLGSDEACVYAGRTQSIGPPRY